MNALYNIQRPRLVSIEGNIGAGKSTLIQKLKEKYAENDEIMFLQEPVDIWESIKCPITQKNMLQKFYENPSKYGFSFQIMAFHTRLELIKNAIANASENCKTIVMERSLDADAEIFAKMLKENGILEDIEYQIYQKITLESLKEYSSDGIIWLNIPFETCYERIQKRARKGEEDISCDYLEKCEQYHVEWLGADLGFVLQIDESGGEEGLEKYLFM
jgi:deoxyadenosine/deoxycytidine kinase